jgi:hypothetical protein
MGAIYKKAAEGIASLVKRPTGKYIRTEKQRLAQSLRAQAREKSTDTFKYEGKTYPKSEGVKAFYKSEKNKSGTAYKWVPKDVRGRGFGNPALRESEYAIKQIKEANLIKDKLRELDVEELKGMYGPDLVKYIKDTLNFKRTPRALQLMQQEVVGGGWKKGKGPRGSAGPGKFTYGGKTYLKSEGVQTKYIDKRSGKEATRWTPKHIRGGKPGNPLGWSNPEQAAEREAIRTELKKIDKETLKGMTGNELRSLANKIPGINRKSANAIYEIREEVIGGGWKAGQGKRPLVGGKLARFSGINDLSPENFNKVRDFLSIMQKSSDVLYPIIDRMVKFAKRKGVPEEQIMKKLYDTDIEGISNIIIKKHELRKLYREAKKLGLDPDVMDLSHIDSIERNWEKALDPSNLFFANYKSNRYLQKDIEKQINILRDAIPKAKSLADKKMIAQQKIVLDPTKRKEHMYEYYKPRTLAEMREELAEANLVSEIGGTRRGAKIDPNDPYFAEKLASKLRSDIEGQKGQLRAGAYGMAGGGLIKKLLGESLGNMSRRKFLKGMGATAAHAALPRVMAEPTKAVAKKAAFDFAPPWVSQMATALETAVKHKKQVKLPNGTVIYYLKKPHTEYDSHKLAVKTVDGEEDLVNYKARKNGDEVEIEFDIRDEGHNNQHIFLDRKNKVAELIDENYYMTSPEDFAKDDPIIWDVSKPAIRSDISQTATSDISKRAMDKSIILDKSTKADDYIYDYMSMPEGSDYNYMWERYVDSFSPAGNIFKTKEYARQMRKQEARQKKLREEREMDRMSHWEEQFRGGHGTHGYYRGGMSMKDYPRHNLDMERVLDSMSYVESRNRPNIIGPSIPGRSEKAHGLFQILPSTAKDPGYRVTPWKNFSNEWKDPIKQRDFANRYLTGLLNHHKGNWHSALSQYGGVTDPGSDYYWDLIMNQYNKGGIARRPNAVPPTSGPESDFVSDGIEMIKNNPQRFVAGGLVKRYAPKVLGKKSMYKPQIEARKLGKGPDLSRVRADLYEAPKGPYTLTDESGVRILDRDFQTLEGAQIALKDLAKLRTQDASTFKIFGKRPPKTAEGVSEPAPEVNLGMVGKPLPKEKPAALFWGSREKIINAPYEVMTGKQWLRFLRGFDEEQVFADTKKAEEVLGALRNEGKILSKDFGDAMKRHRGDKSHPDVIAANKLRQAHHLKIKKANDDLARLKLAEREGAGKEFHERVLTLRAAQKEFPPVRDMELNDTGLAPHLTKNSSKMLSKEQLVKDFDERLAPEIEVSVLGKTGGEGEKFYKQMSKMDMDAYREGPLKNVLKGIRNRAHPLREALSNNNNDEILKIIDEIDNLTFENFGVANAIKEGFPQKFPFELKKVLQDIAQSSGVRTAGFKKYARDVQYSGQQTLGGGQNYREFLFRYKHPAGSLRETEPMKRYEDLSSAQHFSSLSDKDQMGGFVHTRVSDRTDEFGRRILHIEEIQSDLHQLVNAARRRVRKAKLEGKRPKASDIKLSNYAPRGDMIREPIDLANEQQMQLVLSKIEDLSSMPQTKQTQIRIERLNKERAKIRKIIEDKRAKMSEGMHSGFPMGPLSKSEDYNEFVMKYLTKVAQEGGYDGVTISSGAIKNRGEAVGSLDWKGNRVAYGPIAEGAMKRAAKKSGAKYLKTSIIDDQGRGWSVPMIWLDNAGVKYNVQKGMPIYKKGGMVVNG